MLEKKHSANHPVLLYCHVPLQVRHLKELQAHQYTLYFWFQHGLFSAVLCSYSSTSFSAVFFMFGPHKLLLWLDSSILSINSQVLSVISKDGRDKVLSADIHNCHRAPAKCRCHMALLHAKHMLELASPNPISRIDFADEKHSRYSWHTLLN